MLLTQTFYAVKEEPKCIGSISSLFPLVCVFLGFRVEIIGYNWFKSTHSTSSSTWVESLQPESFSSLEAILDLTAYVSANVFIWQYTGLVANHDQTIDVQAGGILGEGLFIDLPAIMNPACLWPSPSSPRGGCSLGSQILPSSAVSRPPWPRNTVVYPSLEAAAFIHVFGKTTLLKWW